MMNIRDETDYGLDYFSVRCSSVFLLGIQQQFKAAP